MLRYGYPNHITINHLVGDLEISMKYTHIMLIYIYDIQWDPWNLTFPWWHLLRFPTWKADSLDGCKGLCASTDGCRMAAMGSSERFMGRWFQWGLQYDWGIGLFPLKHSTIADGWIMLNPPSIILLVIYKFVDLFFGYLQVLLYKLPPGKRLHNYGNIHQF